MYTVVGLRLHKIMIRAPPPGSGNKTIVCMDYDSLYLRIAYIIPSL